MKKTNPEASISKNVVFGGIIGGVFGLTIGVPTATAAGLWALFAGPFIEAATKGGVPSSQAPFCFPRVVGRFGLFGASVGASIGAMRILLQSESVTKATDPSDSAKSDSPKF